MFVTLICFFALIHSAPIDIFFFWYMSDDNFRELNVRQLIKSVGYEV